MCSLKRLDISRFIKAKSNYGITKTQSYCYSKFFTNNICFDFSVAKLFFFFGFGRTFFFQNT